ncbi:MASE1 domain-containing protein [Candidatus Lokiarchaeum ossiferum]|uniref:MASE1 domain-containing protein n=1 Tax=Candidatus Lokiarchaeum ossiferum TaxID=2951803 RepID=UPI00352CB14F
MDLVMLNKIRIFYQTKLSKTWKIVLANIFITLFIIFLGRVSFILIQDTTDVVFPLYLPAGFTFLFLFKKSKFHLIGIWIGTFIEALVNMKTMTGNINFSLIIVVALIASGNSLQPFIISTSFEKKWITEDFLIHPSSLIKFLLVAILSCLSAGIIGSSVLIFGSYLPVDAFFSSVFSWWLSDLAAILIISPIFLTKSYPNSIDWHNYRKVGELIVFLGLSIVFQLIILVGVGISIEVNHFEYLILPLIIWAVFRFSPQIAVNHMVLVSLSMIYGILKGNAPFSSNDIDQAVLLSQFYLFIIAFTNLLLMALVAERFQITLQLKDYTENLELKVQNTVKRMKILSGFLPMCASCKKIRNDNGTWDNLEQFIDQHSQAKLTHSYCPDCSKKLLDELD